MELKTKLKIKSAVLSLFWQSAYEFVAPYDFDECIRRIDSLGAKYWDENSTLWNLVSAKFGVDSQQDNGGVFNFKMSGSQRRVMLDAELRGQLLYENDQKTQVKVAVGFTGSSTLALIVLIVVIFILFFLITDRSPTNLTFTASIIGFVLLVQSFYGYSLKAELYHDLRDTLTKNNPPLDTSIN